MERVVLKMSEVFSLNNIKWNYNYGEDGCSVGGLLKMSNLSGGFHGILKQWWDHYSLKFEYPKVLLVSESNKIKEAFSILYENWAITTLDLYTELSKDTSDIIADICNDRLIDKYDIIINQATLEHLYNPFGAVKNMCESLNKGGYLISHTHAQNMMYHPFPRDYIRFMVDWWYDLPLYIKNIKLIELYEENNLINVVTCYEKIS